MVRLSERSVRSRTIVAQPDRAMNLTDLAPVHVRFIIAGSFRG